MEVRVSGALAREVSERDGSPMERMVEKEFLAIRLWAFYNQCHTPTDGTFCEGEGVSSARKSEKSGKHPASDYAYTPDLNKSSTWKLRLTNKPGGKPDPRIVGAAVAALGKGFRGRKVQLPAEARAEVVTKVRAAWLKANPKKSAEDLPAVLQEAVHVEAVGEVMSFGAFSNECHDPGSGKFCEASGGSKTEDVPVEDWVRKLSDEKLTYEWKFAYGEDDGFGPSGISGQNTKYEMWGKVWPVYKGQGSTNLAHEGIIYYGRLQSLLMIETDHRRRGMPVPARPNLLGANGEVHHGSDGSNWPAKNA